MTKRHEDPRGQPHDSIFKATFSEPANALDLLRQVVPAVAEAIDAGSLRHEPGNFVEVHSDVLLSARLRDRPALLYVLFEHQSAQSRYMPLRLTRYVLRIWERWLRDHPDATTLPAVIPVVVHQGPGRWEAPRRLAELIDLPAALLGTLERVMPGLDMLVHDLGGFTPAELAARPSRHLVRVTLTLMRGVHDPSVDVRDLLRLLAVSFRELSKEAGGIEGLRLALLYTVRQRAGVDADARRLVEDLREVAGSSMGETAKSMYQSVLDEGARALVERQLRTKFGALPDAVIERLHGANTAELETWSERLLTADRLEDVFTARPRRAKRSSAAKRKRRK